LANPRNSHKTTYRITSTAQIATLAQKSPKVITSPEDSQNLRIKIKLTSQC
jgi:hypothetical protein